MSGGRARLEASNVWKLDELIALLEEVERVPVKRGSYRKTRERRERGFQTEPLPFRGINKSLTAEAGFSLQARNTLTDVSAIAYDLRRTAGYLVADRVGRVVGRVECPMYGTAPDVPDALAVRGGFLSRRRRLVPAEAIEQIDGRSGVIGLSIDRDEIRSFL